MCLSCFWCFLDFCFVTFCPFRIGNQLLICWPLIRCWVAISTWFKFKLKLFLLSPIWFEGQFKFKSFLFNDLPDLLCISMILVPHVELKNVRSVANLNVRLFVEDIVDYRASALFCFDHKPQFWISHSTPGWGRCRSQMSSQSERCPVERPQKGRWHPERCLISANSQFFSFCLFPSPPSPAFSFLSHFLSFSSKQSHAFPSSSIFHFSLSLLSGLVWTMLILKTFLSYIELIQLSMLGMSLADSTLMQMLILAQQQFCNKAQFCQDGFDKGENDLVDDFHWSCVQL